MKKIELCIEQTEEQMTVLKRLAVGYGFQNIHDYAVYVLNRGFFQDVEQHNRLLEERSSALGTDSQALPESNSDSASEA